MVKLIAPHGTIVNVSKPEAVRLRRRGWKPAPKPAPQAPVVEAPLAGEVEDEDA